MIKVSFIEVVDCETVTKIQFLVTVAQIAIVLQNFFHRVVENPSNRIELKHQLNETIWTVERVFLFHVNVGNSGC